MSPNYALERTFATRKSLNAALGPAREGAVDTLGVVLELAGATVVKVELMPGSTLVEFAECGLWGHDLTNGCVALMSFNATPSLPFLAPGSGVKGFVVKSGKMSWLEYLPLGNRFCFNEWFEPDLNGRGASLLVELELDNGCHTFECEGMLLNLRET